MTPIALFSLIAAQSDSLGRAGSSAEALQDAHVSALDSIRVESPLPDGVAQVVRFLLSSVPSWVQIGGIILAAVVGLAVAWLIFSRRRSILGWVRTRSTPVKVGIGVAAVVGLSGAGTAGAVSWNYTQHSNDFCVACHVMDPAVERMTGGTSKHADLSCHDCHQQSVAASAWQLYLWVLERPEDIQKHASVPNRVCETCHVTQDTAAWQQIASTAGHRVHLESDSIVLKEIRCVECHGTELHQFQPATMTCGQSACHKPTDTEVVLGKMAGQTVRHCTSCHEFTAVVPVLATLDSARGTLVPGTSQCLGCHEMQKVLADFEAGLDPHGGKCGMCHNPHTQETPQAAALTCATSGCHSNWREEPFHSGENHRRVGSQCLLCHQPHRAKVDASGCEDCHRDVRARGPRRPPLPFDTSAALRRSNAEEPRVILGSHDTSPQEPVRLAFSGIGEKSAMTSDAFRLTFDPPPVVHGFYPGVDPPPAPPAAPDSFPHSRHEHLACLVCHQTQIGQGRLTFERPRGCAICHHQAPARSRCAQCHETAEFTAPITANAVVTVPGHSPRPRSVEFRHSTHSSRTCLECHTTPVTLAPSPAKAVCKDCHEDHHTANQTCSTCHAAAQPATAHKTLEAAHRRCDACHTASTVAVLTPTRNFCSTCHIKQSTNHYDNKECSTCHFLAEPSEYRSRLLTRLPR